VSLEGIGARTDRGHNMVTRSGLPFFPLQPDHNEIRLADIAAHLSKQCRFVGATRVFYSVAEHCVRMSWHFAPGPLAREALLHDAAEAYIGDLIRPVKADCPDWRAIDARVDAACRARFGLPGQMSAEIRLADLRMAMTERRELIAPSPTVDWGDNLPPPYLMRIGGPRLFGRRLPGWRCWSPARAEREFLKRAQALAVS
jgi:hypothetical protein